MRGSVFVASAAACLLSVSVAGTAAGQQQADEGTSVETDGSQVEMGVWIEVDVPGASEPAPNPADPTRPPCYFQQGNSTELNAWLDNGYVVAPNPDEVYILKLCETDEGTHLVTYWVYQTAPLQQPPPPTFEETTRLRNEAWGLLAIPVPTTLTAPQEIAIVHLPIYVWVSAADRTPVTETVTTVAGWP